jgi:hypothetical protein
MGTTVNSSKYNLLDEESQTYIEFGTSIGMSHTGNQGMNWTVPSSSSALSMEVTADLL